MEDGAKESGLAAFAERHPLGCFVIFAFGGILLVRGLDAVSPPPSAVQISQHEVAAREEAVKHLAAKQIRVERDKMLCRLKSTCTRYAAARQECAVAGSYDKCLRIKLGNDDYLAAQLCNEDGSLPASDDEVPGAIRCFALGLIGSR